MDIKHAIKIISFYHQGQTYGPDMPYFLHPIEVANELKDLIHSEYLAALFHDTIEDCNLTETTLRGILEGDIVDMVVLLTKDKNLSYRENIQKIIDSGNKGAMRVKLADNQVNLRGDKSKMSSERAIRLKEKYEMSIQMLETALQNKD